MKLITGFDWVGWIRNKMVDNTRHHLTPYQLNLYPRLFKKKNILGYRIYDRSVILYFKNKRIQFARSY